MVENPEQLVAGMAENTGKMRNDISDVMHASPLRPGALDC